jgi:hypothetical protein
MARWRRAIELAMTEIRRTVAGTHFPRPFGQCRRTTCGLRIDCLLKAATIVRTLIVDRAFDKGTVSVGTMPAS